MPPHNRSPSQNSRQPSPRRFWRWAFWTLAIACCLSSVSAQQSGPATQPALTQKPETPRYWTTNWSFQEVDLSRLISRFAAIGITIPVDAEGKVSVDFKVSVPLRKLRDGKAYRFQGELTAPRLRVDKMWLSDVSLSVDYENGTLRLYDLRAIWAEPGKPSDSKGPATLAGELTMQLLPMGDLQTDIQIDSISVGALLRQFAAESLSTTVIEGRIDARLNATVPMRQVTRLDAWKGTASAEVESLQIAGRTPFSVETGTVQLRNAVVLADSMRLRSSASPPVELGLPAKIGSPVELGLAGEFELTGRQRFQFRLTSNDFPLGELAVAISSKPNQLDGKLDFDLVGRGELSPVNLKRPTWKLSGQVGSPQLVVMGQNIGLLEHQFEFDSQRLQLSPIDNPAAENEPEMRIKRLQADYRWSPDALEVTQLSADLFDGNISGHATLARGDTGTHRIGLQWNNLRPSLALAGLENGGMNRGGLRVAGNTSGNVEWSIPVGALNLPAQHSGKLRIDLPSLELASSHVGQATIEADAQGGTLRISGSGELFGGTLLVDAEATAKPDDTWTSIAARKPVGHARMNRMQLDRIARVLWPRAQRRWRGSVSTSLEYHEGKSLADKIPSCQIVARDLAVDGQTLSRQLNLQIMFRPTGAAIERVAGRVAGGHVWADGSWSLGDGERRLQLRLSDVELSDAFWAVSPKVAAMMQGDVSGSVTLTQARGFRFRGVLTARDSAFFSIPTGSLRSGVHGTFSDDFKRWDVNLPRIQGDLASGQIAGGVQLSSSSSRPGAFDMSSRWNAHRVDFGELLAAADVSTKIAHGRITGEIDLGGRGIRGISDLKGRFDARLGTTQAAAVPGLVQADQFLGLITMNGNQFNEGRLKGLIGAGTATIERFELNSDRIRVWSQGRVRLDNLRMDLEVSIFTGDFRLGDDKLLAFASQLAVQSVFPVATLVEVNRILRNRAIYLDFTGTLSDPRLRLKPLAIIREEALQFLLRELLVAASLNTG